MQGERIQSMELDLERVEGVHTARIQAEDGEITEVHIVSDPARRPKWVVRDVITTLFARHGIRVPHQRISVAGSAPCAEATAEVTESATDSRIRVSSVQLAREGDSLSATVELCEDERSVRTTKSGLATRSNQLRIVAAATLEGVRKLTSGLIPLQLEETRSVQVGEVMVVLAHVVHLGSEGERSLIGSCPDADGRMDAPAGAVLDAVNRILRPYRAQEEEIEYEVEEDRTD